MEANRATTVGEWRRGWPVVLGAVAGISAGPALFQNMSSLFVPGMMAEFGWTRAQIATASGLGLAGSLAVPAIGRVVDRLGVRPVIAGCMVLLGAAYLGLSAMTGALWHYYLLVLSLAPCVPGTSALVYGKVIAARFGAQRGLALGIATSGLPLATLVLPTALGTVIAARGWRGGFVALAVFVALIALPVALLAIRGVAMAAPASSPAATITAGMDAAAARRDPRFWRLALTGFCINMATVGFVTQLVPFGIERGLTAAAATLLLTAFGASQVVARVSIGALIDRRPPQRVAAIVAILSAAGFVALQARTPDVAWLAAAVFLAGLMNGAENDLYPFFTARLFGLRAYGEIYGTLIVVALAGSAVGIIGFGHLHDRTGGDDIALAIATAAMLASAVSYLGLRDRAPPPAPPAAA